ncbi:hypothetical protein [Laspinema olomoucense]|uniref:Uncharacterized protein n=1 Tax=Laspinema olomoucense D3b TaxID=2953688 RepID=A0ABT2N4Q1_9CYAN|nr:hypothetical protein [Laspinema sp. D3b]MCT7977662.1 hypothetical protein [Laspinema sp. D3b]
MEYIIYHQRGFGLISAWVAYHKYPNRKLIGWQYDYPIPQFLQSGDRLTIIDFRFPTSIVNQWKSKMEVEQILKTESKSATTVAWKKWFPGQSMPLFLKYIQDWNLGKYELPETQLIVEAIASLGWTFKVFDLLASMNYDALIKFCNNIPKPSTRSKNTHTKTTTKLPLIPHRNQLAKNQLIPRKT